VTVAANPSADVDHYLDGSDSIPVGDSPRVFDHRVQFYEDAAFLYGVIADFFQAGLQAGEPLVIIATDVHRRGFVQHLETQGLDVNQLLKTGELTLLDAQLTLSDFMVDGAPDPNFFRVHVGSVLETLRSRSRTGHVRAYGEMVDLLWRDGNPEVSIRLEELWNDLSRSFSLSLLCGYFIGNFADEAHGVPFQRICAAHAHVVPTEIYPLNGDIGTRLREVTLLEQRARALEKEVEHRRRLEQVLRDALAERQRAQEALRASQLELMDFFENAAEGLHWVGPDGIILMANRAEMEMLGYTRDEYIGHHITEFHVDQDVIADILVRLKHNETIKDYEARLRHKDGSVRHVLIHSNSFFRDGEFVHSRCFTRDITDRKRLEGELRSQNEDLARTVRFSEMFVGILGHDLRNPLSAIATAASLLRRRADSDKVIKPATRILNSSARMGRMIDQLLDFTRIRLGKGIPIDQKTTDLAEVCRLAMDEFESVGEADRIRLEFTGDSVGLWDVDRLLQLVSNLVSNALTHGEPSQTVTIHVDGSDSQTMALEVHNAGSVPPGVLPVLFEPFRSGVNSKEEHSNGLGLGLFISQQIVLAHCGTITVSSSSAEGTLFVVRLPRNPHRLEPAFGVAAGAIA
jgi:PAS domain S-box-containing protein